MLGLLRRFVLTRRLFYSCSQYMKGDRITQFGTKEVVMVRRKGQEITRELKLDFKFRHMDANSVILATYAVHPLTPLTANSVGGYALSVKTMTYPTKEYDTPRAVVLMLIRMSRKTLRRQVCRKYNVQFLLLPSNTEPVKVREASTNREIQFGVYSVVNLYNEKYHRALYLCNPEVKLADNVFAGAVGQAVGELWERGIRDVYSVVHCNLQGA
jgi:hypothetical protein